MTLAYMPGSVAHRHLKKIARLLGGKPATEFYGITVGGKNILYRHGLTWTQRSGEKKLAYDQIVWHRPFGRTVDHRKVDYVLLHADTPLFLLFPVKTAMRLAMAYPRTLNLAADPQRLSETRQRIWDARVSLEELKRKLRA